MNTFNIILCRYSEIALKKKNRWIFENHLIDRIRSLIKENKLSDIEVSKIRGRIFIFKTNYCAFSEYEQAVLTGILKRIFGIDSFSFAIKASPNIDDIRKKAIYSADRIVKPKIEEMEKEKKGSFRIRARRIWKDFPLKTRELEIELSKIIYRYSNNLTVNLEQADITLYCEVHKDLALIFYEIIYGQGGLPSGTNPPVLSLLSGGFDSPVASYMLMRRGVFVDYITFHSYPFTPKATNEKIDNLVKILNSYQGNRILFSCNFLNAQKMICSESYESFRTVHYRRVMFILAEKIAKLNGNKALVTGESVGQVASQTITNLTNIDSAIDMMVLRPLIGMDKKDIIKYSRKIGTFDISKIQTPDSCTVFMPSNPSTAAPIKIILAKEKKMNIDKVIETAFNDTEVIDIEHNIKIPAREFFKKI